jgi:pimeloyl-ACP methyl ester carboxylesterase
VIRASLLALLLFCACAHSTPVLFVHGNGASAHQWRAQLAHLQPSRAAYAFDLPGMGQAPPASDYSVAANADAIGRAADSHHLQRFVLVAHSYGGAPAAYYASKHPDRVAALILVDSAFSIHIDDAPAKRFADAIRADRDKVVHAWFAPILKNSSPEVQKEVFDDVAASNIDAFIGALEGLRHIDMKALLDAYPGPKFAVAAADVESPQSLHMQYPSIAVKKIAGTGHWLMLDKPDDVNRALDEILNGIR